jgi:hypothetical protein
LRDDVRAGGALGDPLRHQQRDERAAETEQRRHHQQAGIGRGIDAEHRHDDADQRQHGQVGGQEQSDTFELVGGFQALRMWLRSCAAQCS